MRSYAILRGKLYLYADGEIQPIPQPLTPEIEEEIADVREEHERRGKPSVWYWGEDPQKT